MKTALLFRDPTSFWRVAWELLSLRMGPLPLNESCKESTWEHVRERMAARAHRGTPSTGLALRLSDSSSADTSSTHPHSRLVNCVRFFQTTEIKHTWSVMTLSTDTVHFRLRVHTLTCRARRCTGNLTRL